jgi:hypothetical protein
VWKKDHRGSDHSNPDKLCTCGRSSTGEFLTYFYCIFIIIGVVMFTVCSLCRKSIRTKWSNGTMKASTGRTSPLTARPSMPAEVEKHMDGEMRCFV